MLFQDWLKLKRSQKGINQSATAVICGLTQPQYSLLERGKSFPTKLQAEKLFKYFERSQDEAIEVQTVEPVVSEENVDDTDSSSGADGESLSEKDDSNSSFCLQLDEETKILADRYQYILQIGAQKSYYVNLKSLFKSLVQMTFRRSAISTVNEMSIRIEEINKKIDKYFSIIDDSKLFENRE